MRMQTENNAKEKPNKLINEENQNKENQNKENQNKENHTKPMNKENQNEEQIKKMDKTKTKSKEKKDKAGGCHCRNGSTCAKHSLPVYMLDTRIKIGGNLYKPCISNQCTKNLFVAI